MGFPDAVKYKIEPVTGQVPIAGFFMPILSSSEVLLGGVRTVLITFFTFVSFFQSSLRKPDSKYRI